MNRPARNWILIVATERIVVTVCQIQPTDVSIAIHADITDFDGVWSHIANQGGSDEKTIAVEFAAAPIVVIVPAGLNRVALPDKILPKNIRDVDILMPPIEAIQTTVCIFLKLCKIRHVILITIIIKRSENSRGQIVI